MSEGLINIAVKVPGKAIEFREVKNELEVFQEIVEGYVELVKMPVFGGLAILCNEEGRIHNLPYNFTSPMGDIVGTAIFVSEVNSEGNSDDNFHGLSAGQAKLVKDNLG